MEILNKIQKSLKAPKGQHNNFGNYNYRSCEDILEAIKPLLGEAVLTLNDEVVLIGSRTYIKATATLAVKEEKFSVSAYAREAEVKKGMDEAQITGAASSYARKYALNGLFCIDDTKDADSNETAEKPIEYINESEVSIIQDTITALNNEKPGTIIMEKFLAYMKISDMGKILKSDYQRAINVLEGAKKRIAGVK